MVWRTSMPASVDHQDRIAGFNKPLSPVRSSVRRGEPFRALEASAVHEHNGIRPRHCFWRFPFHIHRAALLRQPGLLDAVLWHPEMTAPHVPR